MDRVRLRTRFIILFMAISIISLLVYSLWSSYTQQRQTEKSMLEKAYVLSRQMDAMWRFMSLNQDRINYDRDGEYNFKGLHCSLVGKSIGKIFGLETNYITRYVNFNPRNTDDFPDSFEAEALKKFHAGYRGEVHSIVEYNGALSFRYVVPKYIDNTCLDCHGEPAGELDVLGYPKEGWKEGDLAGALSMVMPTDIYIESQRENIVRDLVFFCLLVFMLVLIIYYVTARLVTNPLSKLKTMMEKIANDSINTQLDSVEIEARGEIKDLTNHFNNMIRELRNVYNDLENKVNMRTEDLAKANKILEEQQAQLEAINNRLREDNLYKSDFLAIMSHELRTPLTSIIAFTEMLNKLSTGKSLKEKRIIAEMNTNNHILLSLINNILDMARLEAGKLGIQYEQVDYVDIANVVLNVIEPLAAKKKIDIDFNIVPGVPIIVSDREHLRRILENLASNAVKFTNSGGAIKLYIYYDAYNDNIIIDIADNGIGIAAKDQKMIFDKFVQGDNSISRPYSGSGLGLALVKELTELLGGTIQLESELGKGSRFIVTLPARSREDVYEDNVGR